MLTKLSKVDSTFGSDGTLFSFFQAATILSQCSLANSESRSNFSFSLIRKGLHSSMFAWSGKEHIPLPGKCFFWFRTKFFSALQCCTRHIRVAGHWKGKSTPPSSCCMTAAVSAAAAAAATEAGRAAAAVLRVTRRKTCAGGA